MGEEKTPVYESQRQRWVKYGGNVALSIVVVVALAAVVCYATTKYSKRADMTVGQSYSLKPQTKKVLAGLKDKVTIVSLYPRAREGEQGERAAEDASQYQAVQDLLDEYSQQSSKVETDAIDPVTEPAKLDQLITRVTQQYGSEVKKYQDYLAAYPKFAEKVKAFGEAENKNLQALPFDKVQDPQLSQTLLLTQVTVQGFPPLLQDSLESIKAIKKQKIPNYKGVTEDVQGKVEQLSQLLDSLIQSFKQSKDDPRVPKEIRDYFTSALPRYTDAKKLIDDELKKIKDLGELKLDTLRESLRQEKTILVMGKGDIKVLPQSAVWKQTDTRGLEAAAGAEQAPKTQFAGEQQVTTAIVALTSPTKPKVCFVRPGGASLTTSMMGQGAPFSEIAQRLKDANFEVTEKDLSGQWEMQAQMQGMPVAPEPTDEQIKDAIWVVLDFSPAMGRQGPNPMGEKVAEHLKQGGAALVLAFPNADPMDSALKDYGIKLDTDAVAVHELIANNGGQAADQFEEAQRYPFIFLTTNYGSGPIARPLQSLESLLSPLVPVSIDAKAPAGVTVTPLIPVQRSIKTWGEKDELQQALNGEATKFTPGVDIPNTDADPMYGGAMVEKAGEKGKPEQRVVAIGSLQFLMDRLLTLPDVDVFQRERRIVPRFPGNSELMMNSVYWLARMETMMDISPAAMQVSRIKPMSAGAQNFWKVGVMMFGLPGLVVVIGAMVYVKRQD